MGQLARSHTDDGCCPLCGQRKPAWKRYTHGDLTIQDGEITKGAVTIRLGPVQYAILAAMATRAGRPITVNGLWALVYSDNDRAPSEKNIDVQIHHLRRIMGHAAIETRFGGYRIFWPDRVILRPEGV